MANLPEPTTDIKVARQRIKDYCAATHTLYNPENPEPEGLIVDSAMDWSGDGLGSETHYLLLADLELLVSSESGRDEDET